MGVKVTVEQGKLNAALKRFLQDKLPEAVDVATRKIALDVLYEVAGSWPVDTGRSRSAWLMAAGELGGLPAGGTEALPGDALVEPVETDSGITYTVTNAVPYALFIEEGTAATEGGHYLAQALAKVQRRLTFGREQNSLGAEVARAWQEATEA